MRRRKRNPYTWMPTLGSRFTQEGQPGYASSTLRVDLSAPNNLATPPSFTKGLVTLAVIPDFPVQVTEDNSAQYVLRDLTEGQDWVLKRMVGKAHFWALSDRYTFAQDWSQVYLTLGFFVARAIDDEPSDVDLVASEVDPQNVENIRQPWIWRRSWVLSNPFWARTASPPVGGFDTPTSNMEYGSVADGPHIDSKVSRRIMRDQRLWLAASLTGVNNIGALDVSETDPTPLVSGLIDLRILGAMRRSKDRPAF